MCICLIAGLFQTPAAAQSASEFYKGKRMQIICGDKPGGVTDLTARFIAKNIAGIIGADVIQVVNKPGAAHLEAYNYMWNAKPDGLTLGMEEFTSVLSNDINDVAGAKYEAEKFNFIGSVGDESTIFWVKKDGPIQSAQDLIVAKGVILAATSPAGGRALDQRLIAYVLDLDAKVVPGFKGDKATVLAIRQGEATGTSTSLSSYRRGEKAGTHKALFAVADSRHPAAPEIPALTEVADIDKDKMEILNLRLLSKGSWTLYAPPGMPEDRLAYLRDAFNKMGDDKDTMAALEKIWYPGVPLLTGVELQKRAVALKQKKDVWKETFQNFLFEKYRP